MFCVFAVFFKRIAPGWGFSTISLAQGSAFAPFWCAGGEGEGEEIALSKKGGFA